EVQKITVGDVHTTHPKAGSRSLTKVVPPTDGIKRILGKLADLPQEAEKEAKTVAELKAEIVRMKRDQPKTIANADPADKARIKELEERISALNGTIRGWVKY